VRLRKSPNATKKVLFCLGWLGVGNLFFWAALIMINNLHQEDKFWNPNSFKVVYVFGWINFIFVVSFFLFWLMIILLGVE